MTYPPPARASKPSPIEEVRIEAPAGTRIDPAAVPQCTATDAELRLRGLGACPRESRLGRGKVVANTGLLPGPMTLDAVVVAAPRQLVEIVLIPGTELVIATDRLDVDGTTLTGHPPATPGGPPDFRTAVEEVEFLLAAPPVGAPAVITTPPSCPADGRWRSGGRFSFADGVVAHAEAASPCAVAAKKTRKSKKARPDRKRAKRRRQ